MEFFPNFPAGHGIQPDVWAVERENEGWHGICASDHLWVGETRYPHVFVAATRMACATQRLQITTSFCNNLFRSPVEFAQAALALQDAAAGRFEAGLGAGWLADEIAAMGEHYPPGPERVSRYVEALSIVRQLLHTRQCQHQGEFYQVDISGDRQLADTSFAPPLLVASAGGPRSVREVTPLVDRVEIKASARATRVGHLDFSIMSTVSHEEVYANVCRVRELREDVPIGIFLLVGAGDEPVVQATRAGLGDGFLSQFFGQPEAVAEALLGLAEMGIDRVQLTELTPASVSRLAPNLLS